MPRAKTRPKTPPSSSAILEALARCELGDLAAAAKALDSLGEAPSTDDACFLLACSELGAALADARLFESIQDLAARGWAKLLHPPASDDAQKALFSLLCSGPDGFKTFDMLMLGGAEAFGPKGKTRKPGLLLSKAAGLPDEAVLAKLLEQLRIEAKGAPRQACELSYLARSAMSHPERRSLLIRVIRADPQAWSAAGEPDCECLAKVALTAGVLDVARAILQTGPELALSKTPSLRVDQFRHPVESIRLLAEFGADMLASDDEGFGALHRAASRNSESMETVAELLSMGCDPRAKCRRGSSAIGAAALQWSWAELREAFGATAKDLMDSNHSRRWDPESLPAPLQAIKQAAEGLAPVREDQDRRLAEILTAAGDDPRTHCQEFVSRAAQLCCENGLTACLASALELGSKRGILPKAEDLAGCLNRPSSQPVQNEGRLRCLDLALAAGVEPDQPIAGYLHDRLPQAPTLIHLAATLLVRSASEARGVNEMASIMAKLAGMGCDPQGAADDDGELQWSFDPAGPGGRSNLPPAARHAFESIDALVEAKSLRQNLPQASPSSKRVRM